MQVNNFKISYIINCAFRYTLRCLGGILGNEQQILKHIELCVPKELGLCYCSDCIKLRSPRNLIRSRRQFQLCSEIKEKRPRVVHRAQVAYFLISQQLFRNLPSNATLNEKNPRSAGNYTAAPQLKIT